MRASVTEARVTVYVCVHMPRECVCERKDVHAYCSKMLAAQQKKDYTLAELWGGGGLCKVESLKSAEKWQCSSVFKMKSRTLPPCSTEAMVGRPEDRQREYFRGCVCRSTDFRVNSGVRVVGVPRTKYSLDVVREYGRYGEPCN